MSYGRRGGGSGEPASPPVPLSSEVLLLDSRQISLVLGIGRTKAFEMMARAELPVVRMGRCVRVPREALTAWIRDNKPDMLPGIGTYLIPAGPKMRIQGVGAVSILSAR